MSTLKRLIRAIRDSIIGVEQDYTTLSIHKAILFLAVPMILEMFMESLFAVWDMYIVSGLGDTAVSVVGFTESLLTIIYALGLGIGMGTTALVSRRIGEHQPEKASRAAAQSINVAVVLSILISVPGLFFPDKILQMMHADPEVIAEGTGYARWMIGFNGLIMLLFINNAIFRSAGNPALSFRTMIIANVINIILDPCLVLGLGPFPEMGVTGAAVATVIGRGTGVIYQFYKLFQKKSISLHLHIENFRLNVSVMWKVIWLSGGGIMQFLIATSSWVFLYRILAHYGSSVVAGYTIAIRIFIFFLLPGWGLSNAASTLVGQNLGAGNPQRAQTSVWYTVVANVIYLLIAFVAFQWFAPSLIGFFDTTGESFAIAVQTLKIISYGILLYGAGMVIAQAFNGAGDTYTPTLVNFIGFWVLEIPIAWLLSEKTPLNEQGVFYAVLIGESFIAVLGIILFLRGKWKLRTI